MKKVVLALSGGVDSAIAAYMLQQEGFAVHGLNLLTWGEDDQRAGVQEIADSLGFQVDFLDVRRPFREQVVQPFLDAYLGGQTPSPCVFCNRQIKWNAILQKADLIGADFVATGHYARLERREGNTELWKAADSSKDQSYMLSFLTQPMLNRTILPLGNYTKPEIRQIAADLGMAVSEKPDSQDLCFLACGDYRDFLRQHAQTPPAPGAIFNQKGELLGQHQGLPFYTIGQRKGLPSSTAALYVIEKRPEDNSLIVGFLSELGADKFFVDQLNWISGKIITEPFHAQVKIRYKASPVEASVEPLGGNLVMVETSKPLRDITAGQIAAFYQGDKLLGGGVIRDHAKIT